MGITRPLERGVEVTEIVRMRHAPQIDLERRETVGHLANALGESTCDTFRAAAVVGGAEGFWHAIWACRKYGVRPTRLGALHKLRQKFGGDSGHVTGHNQVPVRLRDSKGRINAGEGPATEEDIPDNRITKVSIEGRVADQSYVASNCTCFRCNKFHQHPSLKREQGFVAAHAGALPARQDKRRPFHNAEMITLKE